MWLMVQQNEPGDYVIASGVTHSVRELVERSFSQVGLEWEKHVHTDDSLVRGKAELHDLVGDASKARERLGWSPSLDFDGLVRLLVDSDLERLKAGLELAEAR
jgi:GDPmannose 4,6-dehydratase